MPKLCFKFYCENCYYGTSKKSSFENHLESIKHKNREMATLSNKIMPKLCSPKLSCEKCDKTYRNRTGLWRHKKICNLNTENNTIKEDFTKKEISEKDLIIMLIKQNTDMLEVIKNGTYVTNSNNNNSNNKTFNLQFFLNETCKDAMNIMDFVDSIKLQLSDLEKVGEIGYVEGISNIIVDNLKSLDVTKRPVHCTDKKRETLYIKDENKWEKEEDDKNKIRKVIKRVALKNSKLLMDFREKYPGCSKSISKYSDQYNKIVLEAVGGSGNDETEKEDKIIKNIAKNVIIEKI